MFDDRVNRLILVTLLVSGFMAIVGAVASPALLLFAELAGFAALVIILGAALQNRPEPAKVPVRTDDDRRRRRRR